MFKAIILLKRREDLTHDAFAHWWLGEHSPMVLELPKIRKACFNLAEEGGAYDGVSELWFDTQADFEAAYATEHGKAVAADSMAHVSARDRLFVSENWIVE